MEPLIAKMFAAAIVMGVGSIAPAFSEGWIAAKAMEAIGRNPAASDKIAPNMIVAMAIAETAAIFCFVIALIILFAV
ncbi:MAG: ATP synthase F0 subunit C [Candidatus Uhrbacteria bacterium]